MTISHNDIISNVSLVMITFISVYRSVLLLPVVLEESGVQRNCQLKEERKNKLMGLNKINKKNPKTILFEMVNRVNFLEYLT